MKKFVVLTLVSFFSIFAHAQTKKSAAKESIEISNRIIETSCGECNFKLDGNGCSLAVRFDGKAYFVKGADINDYGDAHAQDGFCNSIRNAKVTGKVVRNKFVVKKLELLPQQMAE